MILLIIFLSISILFNIIAIIKMWKKPHPLDDTDQVMSNRNSMLQIALSDYKQGKISKKQLNYFSFVFHPDFRNWIDSVPMERAAYTKQMMKTDELFWKEYGVNPNFRINPESVYYSYREYVLNEWNNNPELFLESQNNHYKS